MPRRRWAGNRPFTLATSYFALLYAVPALVERHAGWAAGAIGTGQLVALLAGSALAPAFAAVAARLDARALPAALIAAGGSAVAVAALAQSAPLLLGVLTLAVFASSSAQATLVRFATAPAPGPQRPMAMGLFNLCFQPGGAFGPSLVVLLEIG
ncbi:hypothetical protein ACFOVU_21330 [Nocardiopsis sediminis]|uniref:MFS transporter n=1 Tax=Nocardiopsis sediminis TaxID=1778267 RepID=A0ABV8FQM9_9ACTN